jgi:hypothetical protein
MSDEEAAYPQEMRIDQINFHLDTTEEIQLYKEIIRVGPRQKTRQSCLEEAAGESPRRLHCFAGNILKVAAKEACYSVSGALFSQRRATCLKGGCCPNVGGESHDL